MRVALTKLDGVASADVTLKRGVVHIELEPRSKITLQRLRRAIRDAGYTSQEAVVTAAGTLSADRRSLLVTGTDAVLRLAPDDKAPEVLQEITRMKPAQSVEISGRVPVPASSDASDTLEVRGVRVK